MKTVGLTFSAAEVKQDTEKLTCPHCGKEYKNAEALAKHSKEKHPDAQPAPPADDTGRDCKGGRGLW